MTKKTEVIAEYLIDGELIEIRSISEKWTKKEVLKLLNLQVMKLAILQ
jgi:hypothetical protein